MKIVSQSNLDLINKLNSLLIKANVEGEFKLKIIDSETEVGAIIEIPSFFNKDKKPYTMIFKENFKTSDLPYSEIIEMLNQELAEMLIVIKPEILKLIRIKEAFKNDSKPDIKNNEDLIVYNIVIHIK